VKGDIKSNPSMKCIIQNDSIVSFSAPISYNDKREAFFCPRVPYIKICSVCNLQHKIIGQRDDNSEYYCEISLECQCGNYVDFEIAVN